MGDVSEHADTAKAFHEAYERLAPSFGYETRRESAVPWEDVPEANRALMTAVCAEVVGPLVAELAEARRALADYANVNGEQYDYDTLLFKYGEKARALREYEDYARDQRVRAEAAGAALAEARRERDEARYSPLGDNHHNAAECPYCGALLAAAEAENARLKAALDCEHPEDAWTYVEHEGETWNRCADCGLMELWQGGTRCNVAVIPVLASGSEGDADG